VILLWKEIRHSLLLWLVAILPGVSATSHFGTRGGPEPANVNAGPDHMDLLISYGTSEGGSVGNPALAIRDQMFVGMIGATY
jgi:hypothetical protein